MEFDFTTIPTELEALDGVPDRFKQFYDKDGESFKLTDLAPLKNANERVKRERDEWKQKASGLEGWLELGQSPDEVKTRLAELEERASVPVDEGAEEKIKSIKEQLVARHEEQSKALKKEIEDLSAKLSDKDRHFQRTLIEKEAVEAISKEGGNARLLTHLVAPHLSLREKDGRYVTEVMQDDGKTIRVKSDGEPMAALDLVKELKSNPEFQGAFNGTGRTGSGASQGSSGGAGKTMTRAEFDALGHAEKSSRMNDGWKVV